jgi:hypothetical protein
MLQRRNYNDQPKGDAMDVRQSAKQVIDFQKIAVDNWFNATALFQAQGASVLDVMLNNSTAMPENSRQAVRNWIQACGQVQDLFKSYVDDSFTHLSGMLDVPAGKAAPKTTKTTSKEGK